LETERADGHFGQDHERIPRPLGQPLSGWAHPKMAAAAAEKPSQLALQNEKSGVYYLGLLAATCSNVKHVSFYIMTTRK
jgi:hypothetical protein